MEEWKKKVKKDLLEVQTFDDKKDKKSETLQSLKIQQVSLDED